MNRVFLLESDEPADSITLERSGFIKRFFLWWEAKSHFVARYNWNGKGQLVSREEKNNIYLFSYDEEGRQNLCYCTDSAGNLVSREIWVWDDFSRLVKSVTTMADSRKEDVVVYEHDENKKTITERNENRVSFTSYNPGGLPEKELFYEDGNRVHVTVYKYDEMERIIQETSWDKDGSCIRQCLYTWESKSRLASEYITNGAGLVIKDEIYTYGAFHGLKWLERVTWIPRAGHRKGRKRRPSEVVYRSFTYGEPRKDNGEKQTITYENGIYHGSIRNGKPEGKGQFFYNDQSQYEGEFHDGEMSGNGRLVWPDGREMTGRFQNGLLDDVGACRWADGSRYEGEFRKGQMHGRGVFVYVDGTIFKGLFQDGHRTDQGVWESLETEKN